MKPIKLTKALIQQMTEEFITALTSAKLSDGKVSYSKAFAYEDKEGSGVTVAFTSMAYTKMLMLLQTFSDEVAWHGTVSRPDPKRFVIEDIFVYPQEVTGATVTTDQERYQEWLMHMDDEQFNALHFQGHSHVNMGVTPSGVDNAFYDSIISQLGPEDFYIFAIFNKKLDHTIKVYDMASNVMYEGKDVTLEIEGDIGQFLADAKEQVVKRTSTYAASKGANVQVATTPTTPPVQTHVATTPGPKSKKGKKKDTPTANDYPLTSMYGGYGGYGGYGSPIDYDEYVFGQRDNSGRRADWWNE